MFNGAFLNSYLYLFGHLCNKGEDIDLPFVNKFVIG